MSVTLAAVGSATITARNGTGSISVPGLKVGDILFEQRQSDNVNGDGNPWSSGIFELTVTVADEIQQVSSGNHSGDTPYKIFFARST